MKLPTNPATQPMSLPVGQVFYLEYTYGKQVDKRMEDILEKAGVKIWKGSKK